MRIDVVLTADAVVPEALAGTTVLVVDVLRASTTIVSALANGAAAIVPVDLPAEAWRRAAAMPGAVVAGERRGERIDGFHLGNSPLEFTADRVRGRTVFLTTSNGTRALLAARQARTVGIAGLVNLSAAAEWAEGERRDVTVTCAGERGAVSLEDHVCAGLLVARLAVHLPDAELTPAAVAAAELAGRYGKDVARLAADSSWARRLARAGHGADVAACLMLDTTPLVPLYLADIDKIVLGPR